MKVYLTRIIPEKAMEAFEENFELRYNKEDRAATKSEILEGAEWSDILCCMLNDKIDREIIEKNKNLKGICNYAVGYNNIDIAAARENSIPVTNTPGVLTETTAELAWALMFACSRRIAEADKFVRAGKFHCWGPTMILGTDLFGKTLGIIGAGRIGQAFAEKAKAFNMRILYHNRSAKPEFEARCGAEKVTLETILKESDFLSLHVPLTDETHHLITLKEFEKMKNSAIIINTSRGSVIKEDDLCYALEMGIIGGAGLDVYEFEPKVTQKLIELDNTVLTPHIGSGSVETRTKMGLMMCDNATALRDGKTPPNLVK